MILPSAEQLTVPSSLPFGSPQILVLHYTSCRCFDIVNPTLDIKSKQTHPTCQMKI